MEDSNYEKDFRYFGGGATLGSLQGYRTCKNSIIKYNSDMKYHNKRFGFTLAEVLITLAVIGIVAAITLPGLIVSHQKKTTVTKLRYAMSVLSQALDMAKSDYGDYSTWDYIDDFDNKDSRKAFVDKYVIPYIKGAKPSERSGYDATGLGYPRKNTPHQPDGYVYGMTSPNYYPITILSGIYYYAGGGGYGYLTFTVDLNGLSGPNQYGRDIFMFYIQTSTGKLITNPYSNIERYCNISSASGCSKMIEQNNWEIPDEGYPWKIVAPNI